MTKAEVLVPIGHCTYHGDVYNAFEMPLPPHLGKRVKPLKLCMECVRDILFMHGVQILK